MSSFLFTVVSMGILLIYAFFMNKISKIGKM